MADRILAILLRLIGWTNEEIKAKQDRDKAESEAIHAEMNPKTDSKPQ